MPEWAQRFTGLHHSDLAQRLYFDPSTRINACLIRWAFGTPAYRRLADARVAGNVSVEGVEAIDLYEPERGRRLDPSFSSGERVVH